MHYLNGCMFGLLAACLQLTREHHVCTHKHVMVKTDNWRVNRISVIWDLPRKLTNKSTAKHRGKDRLFDSGHHYH